MFGLDLFVALALIVLGVVVFATLAFGRTLFAIGAIIVGTVGICFLAGVDPVRWAWEHPDLFFGGIAGYLGIGLAVAVILFIFYVNHPSTQETIRQAKSDWESSKISTPFKDSRYNPFGWDKDFPRIVYWTFFWPFAVVLELFGEVLVKLITWTGRKFTGLFGVIADAAINKALK